MSSTEMQDKPTFEGLGIAPRLFEILSQNKFINPTPIQFQSIPIAVEGKDVMGIAQTGTGKTMAFGIPMIQRLAQNKGRGLVILPTRELALQVDESLQKIGRALGLKTAVLIGGEAMPKQLRQLKHNPHIIIGTPGRINDHLEQRTIDFSTVTILVLDEADRMLDMGFEPQIRKILAKIPTKRQTMLFSATMPDQIVKIATTYMTTPVRVEVARAGTTARDITQEVYFVDRTQKIALLGQILSEQKGSVLVFTRTKFGAKKVAHAIRQLGHTSSEIHSNRSLAQRREALDGFKIGRYRVLVATDIAARGIDVTGIELVINMDLPENPEDYVHRIGRTARAGRSGKAISFATSDQKYDVRSIERLIRSTLPIKSVPQLAPTAIKELTRPERPPFRRDGGKPFNRNHGDRKPFNRNRDARPSSSSSPRPERSGRPEDRKPRHGYVRDNKSRSKFKQGQQGPRMNPYGPSDQGFDANHRKPFDTSRIRYRDDGDSY